MTRKKQRLYNAARRSHNWVAYNKFKKQTQRAIKCPHWDHINSVISKAFEQGNSRPFWRYIKSKRSDSMGVSPIMSQGTLHSDPSSKAELLNAQFESVFTRENEDEELPMPAGPQLPTIDDLFVSAQGVQKLLSQININKASGPDSIPNAILKSLSNELAPVLASIFNQTLVTGQLPDDWRNANISPIFKKGDKHQAANYRPVSLTCVCTKLMEHILVKHILTHLEKHQVLTTLQHGFAPGFLVKPSS